MAVGKGSIIRAGSANAAGKEKEKEFPLSFGLTTKIPIDILQPVPKAWGIPQVESTRVARLTESIVKYGLLLPIIVYRNKEQELLMIKGYHRVAAARKADLTEVPVFFLEVDNDNQAKGAFKELRLYDVSVPKEKKLEVISSITSQLPSYLL